MGPTAKKEAPKDHLVMPDTAARVKVAFNILELRLSDRVESLKIIKQLYGNCQGE